MILLDTSMLVFALRNRRNRLLSRFIEIDAAICGVNIVEVLHGTRDQANQ